MEPDRQEIKEPTSSSSASKAYSRSATNSSAVSVAGESSADQTLLLSPERKCSVPRSQTRRATSSPPRKIALPLSPRGLIKSTLSDNRTPTSVSPKGVELPLSPISIRYETTVPSTPPVLSDTPAILSPSQIPLSLSPPPLKGRLIPPPAIPPDQLSAHIALPPPTKTRACTPPTTSPLPSHPCYTPLTPSPPQRPPRPSFSLPNLRPTIILSPILASHLPPEDRPPAFHLPSPRAHYKRTHTHSPHSSSSSSEYVTALPSPVFFAPRSWSSQGQYTPLNFNTSSTRSEKEKHCELQAFRYDWTNDSITALPPPCPPPTCPLPLPPSPQRMGEPAYSDDKIVVGQKEITVDIEAEPRRLTYFQRHKRTIKMIATLVLIVVLAAGIASGIIWKLQSMCRVKCR